MSPSSVLRPIEPNQSRWEPAPDPNGIVIPGLNATAPAGEQIEQIEQLITMKLQNVDANFSRIQRIMASRILPAVKRYAVSTEPVREAAKFWTTFFEQAAQIRVPNGDDHVLAEDGSTQSGGEILHSATTNDDSGLSGTPMQEHMQIENMSSEVSFIPARAAISSTPATASRRRFSSHTNRTASTPAWTTSLESPLVRLDREVQNLTQDTISATASPAMEDLSWHQAGDPIDATPHSSQSSRIHHQNIAREKGKTPQQGLRQNVLLRNTVIVAEDQLVIPRTEGTGETAKKKTNLKPFNPYVPPQSRTADWNGIVDLKKPNAVTPRGTYPSPGSYRPNTTRGSATPGTNDDESFDFGMSPPITMDFARLPKLGQTPRKEAAERILKSLLKIGKQDLVTSSGGDQSLSTVPTPPSLTRYATNTAETSSSVADASLESLMRRVGGVFDAHHGVSNTSSSTHLVQVSSSRFSPQGVVSSGFAAAPMTSSEPQTPEYPVGVFQYQDEDLEPADTSSDSSLDDGMDNTENPSAAFLLASQQASYEDDDSFDSLAGEDEADMEGGVHPLAHELGTHDGEDDGFEDSFGEGGYGESDGEEETLFGVPPAQRTLRTHPRDLRMLGEGLLEDTMGIGAELVRVGRIEESPTPWGGRGG